MVERVDVLFHFRRKADSMQFIASLQSPHHITNLANLAYAGPGITIFHVNMALRFRIFRRVVIVIRNIAGAIFDEVILRIVTGFGYASARRSQKIGLSVHRHIQIDGFEETFRDETAA